MNIDQHLNCDDCGCYGNNTDSRYFLRKRNVEEEKTVTLKCIECTRPFDVLESEKDWKTHCMTCYMKINGEVTKCRKCKEEIIVWEPNGMDLCYGCYLKKAGVKKKCVSCQNPFYLDPSSKIEKTHCYSCYVQENGVRKKCVDCKTTIYVLESAKNWKKRCADCYYNL
jgi:hypothetical protein